MIRFSVIIPSYNRPAQLAACLESFVDLDYPEGAWELILVNDGGKDTFSAITKAEQELLPLTLIDSDHAGPATARNQGVKVARGEFIAFTDDDCRVDRNWLTAYDEFLPDSPYAAAGGRIANPYPGNLPAETWSRYQDYLRGEVMRDKEGRLLLLTSNNLAYRRDVFMKIGGFKENFPLAAAEDSELGNRLVGSGYQQAYCPKAVVWHAHKNTCWGYLGQQFRYGRGNYYHSQIQKQPDYPRVERHKTSFFGSLGKLDAFARSIKAPALMRTLLFATPFAFKAGNIYEAVRVQLEGKQTPTGSASSPSGFENSGTEDSRPDPGD